MIKFIPGFAGAIAAYVVLKIFGWINSLSIEILLFFCAYLIVTVVVDIAMKKYGEKKG
jgi:ABC-type maltose transport system permease subunit